MDVLSSSNITMKEWRRLPDNVKDYIKRLENKIIQYELDATNQTTETQAHEVSC